MQNRAVRQCIVSLWHYISVGFVGLGHPAQGRDSLSSLNWWVFLSFWVMRTSPTELLRLDLFVEGRSSMFAYVKLLWQTVWIEQTLWFFSTCVVLLIVCLRPLLSEWYDFQTGLESLLFLSGLVGKECVEIRPVNIADGQPMHKQAERRLICVVYNAAVIPSFKNNPTVQAEKPSCKIQYNYWLLPESQSMS